MPIPSTLHLTSRTVPLEGFELRLLRLNSRRLPGWEIRIHTDEDNERLVAEHFPKHLELYKALPHGVMRADVARLVYMHVFGGWYGDTDYEWIRDPDETAHRIVLPLSREDRIGNAVFGSEPGQDEWRVLIDALFEQPGLLGATKSSVEGFTGPEFITGHWGQLKKAEGIWFADRAYFHAPVVEADDRAFGVHHTAGSWRERPLSWKVGVLRRRAGRAFRRLLSP